MSTTTQVKYSYTMRDGQMGLAQFDSFEAMNDAINGTFENGWPKDWTPVRITSTVEVVEVTAPEGPAKPTKVEPGQVWTFSAGAPLWRITGDDTLSVDTMTFWGAEQVDREGNALGPVTDFLESALLTRGTLVS